jgi:hypothetical protein
MTSTRGSPFTTSSPDLEPWTTELNHFLSSVRAGLSPHLLEIRPSRTGLRVFARQGCTVPRGTRLVAFWGELTLDPTRYSCFVSELPETRLQSRLVRPYVDARIACLRGSPHQTRPPCSTTAAARRRESDPTVRAVTIEQPPGTV